MNTTGNQNSSDTIIAYPYNQISMSFDAKKRSLEELEKEKSRSNTARINNTTSISEILKTKLVDRSNL